LSTVEVDISRGEIDEALVVAAVVVVSAMVLLLCKLYEHEGPWVEYITIERPGLPDTTRCLRM
jgi:hypothetical protein